jgi:hypothetical protein
MPSVSAVSAVFKTAWLSNGHQAFERCRPVHIFVKTLKDSARVLNNQNDISRMNDIFEMSPLAAAFFFVNRLSQAGGILLKYI